MRSFKFTCLNLFYSKMHSIVILSPRKVSDIFAYIFSNVSAANLLFVGKIKYWFAVWITSIIVIIQFSTFLVSCSIKFPLWKIQRIFKIVICSVINELSHIPEDKIEMITIVERDIDFYLTLSHIQKNVCRWERDKSLSMSDDFGIYRS